MRAPTPLLALAALAAGFALAGRGDGSDAWPDQDPRRFDTNRPSRVVLPLPAEDDAYQFAVFGDRTGGPAAGVAVLAEAVEDANRIGPDLVMTVGDLIEGYNTAGRWQTQADEFSRIMDALAMPWFPVAGNHDVYWRGPGRPAGEHDANYERHFGPLWYAFEHKDAWFVVLYSDEGNPETGEKTFHKPECQVMSEEQFEWLDRALRKARRAPHVFVFLHHPRWHGGRYGDDWDRVHARLAENGNVTAVFAGHIHRMVYDGIRDGIEYFTLATVGGHQAGDVPDAGYLHQFHLVTVRESGIDVATLPVGSVLDPRAITPEVSRQARSLANGLRARVTSVPQVGVGMTVRGAWSVQFDNPAQRPLEFAASIDPQDPRWILSTTASHFTLAPGENRTIEIDAVHPGGAIDAAWRLPRLFVDAEWVGESHRFALPRQEYPLPARPGVLPAPLRPPQESVLALDRGRGFLHLDDADFALPDGPVTVEGWMHARSFRGRRGFVNKTESSEFGILVQDGRPMFLVHLAGAYVEAQAPDTALQTGRWHHVAGVFDGEEVRLYVDGMLTASRAGSGSRTRNTLPLLVGADVGAAGEANSHFEGLVDEIRISSVARYEGDFEPARRFERDDATVLLLHFDGPSGPWMHDDSPRAAHALRVGATELRTTF